MTSLRLIKGFPGGSDDKESACNAGDLGSVPGSGRSPGEENGYPLQYSFVENSIDRGAWGATYSPWGHKKPDTTERLSLHFRQNSGQGLVHSRYLGNVNAIPLLSVT